MNPVLTSISAATPSTPAPGGQRGKLSAASRQFEAIFVRQMLAEARKTHFGGGDLLGGEGMDTFRQMQDDRFADIAAERGSFGLAKLIEAQLARQAGASPGEQALPQPLPQAGGENAVPGISGGST